MATIILGCYERCPHPLHNCGDQFKNQDLTCVRVLSRVIEEIKRRGIGDHVSVRPSSELPINREPLYVNRQCTELVFVPKPTLELVSLSYGSLLISDGRIRLPNS